MSAIPLLPALTPPHTLCSIYRLCSQSTLDYTFSCSVLKCVYITEVQSRINVQLPEQFEEAGQQIKPPSPKKLVLKLALYQLLHGCISNFKHTLHMYVLICMYIYTYACVYTHVQNNPHYAWYYSVPEGEKVKVEERWGGERSHN